MSTFLSIFYDNFSCKICAHLSLWMCSRGHILGFILSRLAHPFTKKKCARMRASMLLKNHPGGHSDTVKGDKVCYLVKYNSLGGFQGYNCTNFLHSLSFIMAKIIILVLQILTFRRFFCSIEIFSVLNTIIKTNSNMSVGFAVFSGSFVCLIF
jgi:hypothetical protein